MECLLLYDVSVHMKKIRLGDIEEKEELRLNQTKAQGSGAYALSHYTVISVCFPQSSGPGVTSTKFSSLLEPRFNCLCLQ